MPLAANEGVVTHELAHAVFNLLTSRSRGQTVPARYADNWPARPMNLVASLNEGLSDVHGAAMTGDPDFIAPSATALHLDRDLSKHRTYTADMDQALDGDATGYDPYVLGSVFASTFWAFRGRLVDGGMAAADARHEMAQVAFDGPGSSASRRISPWRRCSRSSWRRRPLGPSARPSAPLSARPSPGSPGR